MNVKIARVLADESFGLCDQPSGEVCSDSDGSNATSANRKAYARYLEHNRQYRVDNAEKIREYQAQYRAKNLDNIKEYNKQYRTDNAKKIRERNKQYSAAAPDRRSAQMKQYRSEHTEEARAYSKQYRAANAAKINEQKQQYRAANKEKIRKQKQQSHAKSVEKDQKGVWLRKAFRAAQYRAKKRGLPYDKEFPDLELPDVCPVLGIPLMYPKVNSKRSANSPSLDRINPLLGYVASNLRVISFRANALKNDATVEELRAVIRYMES